MSEVAFIKHLLERDWTESITGRDTDVPEPTFTLEKDDRETNLRTQDVGYVTSGGDTVRTAQGLGWTHDEVETVVTIQYRVAERNVDAGYADPYNRLFGKRTGPDGVASSDRWDGIAGETQRVLRDARKRTAEWDRVGLDITVSDLTDLGGNAYYRADVQVPLDDIAREIDTSV